MKRYIYKVSFSVEVIAENKTDADGSIQELDYNFLETTGCASLNSFEMSDMEVEHIHPLTEKEMEQYFDDANRLIPVDHDEDFEAAKWQRGLTK
jgi:hypothetical protein